MDDTQINRHRHRHFVFRINPETITYYLTSFVLGHFLSPWANSPGKLVRLVKQVPMKEKANIMGKQGKPRGVPGGHDLIYE